MIPSKWWIAVCGCVLAVLWGCESGSRYEFNRRTFRFERVGPRSRPLNRTGTETAGGGQESAAGNLTEGEQIPPPATRTPANLSQRQKGVVERSRVTILYLGNETVQKKPGQQDLYVVRQTTPDKLAELLVLLYPGDGPGGSDRLRFISYAGDRVWEMARAAAPSFDVAPQKIEPGATLDVGAAGRWNLALGLIYGSDFPRRIESDARFRILSLLNQIVKDLSAPADRRWAAAVLAAALQTRYEPRDFVAASATLSQALRFTGRQDYRALVVRYHYIRQLLARGQALAARKQAQDALNYFQSQEDTNCYQFLRTIVEQK
jgi:hypothetical protein